MILECPECSTRFTIPDGALGAAGRRVRCTKCEHVWHAEGESAVEDSADGSSTEVSEKQAAMDNPPAEEQDEALERRERIRAMRKGAQAETTEKAKDTKTTKPWGWISLAMFWVVVLGVFFALPNYVIQALPGAKAVYTWAGIETTGGAETDEQPTLNPADWVVMNQSGAAETGRDERTQLVITGTLENTYSEILPAPTIRGELRDATGVVLREWFYRLPISDLPPGASISIDQVVEDIPVTTSEYELYLEWPEDSA